MHKKVLFPLLSCFFLIAAACDKNEDSAKTFLGDKKNPPAEDFNAAASDSVAIALADKVMEAMGGRENWDDTRYLAWNFFGNRHLIWDKHTGDVRISYPNETLEIIVNINDMTGKVKKNGEDIQHPDSLQKYLTQGKNTWINDSYWLVMPYKLKDSGVTLNYLGEDMTDSDDSAYVLSLTFENVGETPQNMYHVYIDKEDFLVSQFAYFAEASQESPNFSLPWTDYKEYNGILLSGDRGERDLTDIKVMEEIPAHTFKSFEPVIL